MNKLKLILSLANTLVIYLVGGYDVAFQCLVVFMIIDYITGVAKGFKTKKASSKTGIWGIVHKLAIMCLVVMVTFLDRLLNNTGMLRTPFIYFMVANEGISILENVSVLSVRFPKFIKDALIQLKEMDKK